MHKKEIFSGVWVAYSGIDAGNMDFRYGAEDEVVRNRKKLFEYAGIKLSNVQSIDALGGDGFIDLVKEIHRHSEHRTDGLITHKLGEALALYPADCIPLVIYSSSPKFVALVHLGWRGLVAKMPTKVLTYLKEEYDANPADLSFYIGPSIQQVSYSFPELSFEQRTDPVWRRHTKRMGKNWHVNLPGYLFEELVVLGAKSDKILCSDINTADPDKRLFSHYLSVHSRAPVGRNGFIVYCS